MCSLDIICLTLSHNLACPVHNSSDIRWPHGPLQGPLFMMATQCFHQPPPQLARTHKHFTYKQNCPCTQQPPPESGLFCHYEKRYLIWSSVCDCEAAATKRPSLFHRRPRSAHILPMRLQSTHARILPSDNIVYRLPQKGLSKVA